MSTREVTIRARVAVAGRPADLEMTVPAGPTLPESLLGIYRSVADWMVEIGVERAAESGAPLSCRAGCATCCRQLVPVTPMEARALRALVDALPEPRRTQVRERFAGLLHQVQEAGLLDDLRAVARAPIDPAAVAMRYFDLRPDCPFLEDERCSIYEQRPLACREYVVTSAPSECETPDSGRVTGVPLPAKASRLVAPQTTPRIPLPLALEWAAAHPPAAAEKRPGPQLLEDFFRALAGKPPPPPEKKKKRRR